MHTKANDRMGRAGHGMYENGRFGKGLLSAVGLIAVLSLGGGLAHAQPGLVGYWPLDNGSGLDFSGRGNHGTVRSTTPVDGFDGTPNGAMRFDSGTDEVIIPATPSLNSTTSLTVTAWVRGGQASPIVVSKYNTNACRVDWALGTGALGFGMYTYGLDPCGNPYRICPSSVTPFPNTSTWRFVAGSFERASIGTPLRVRVYVDGIESSTTVAGTTFDAVNGTGEPIRIGNIVWINGSRQNFAGDIDDVRIFNRALTPTEIATLATVIVQHPQSTSACRGSIVTFTTRVSGSGPFTFQWRKDGVPLPSNAFRTAIVPSADGTSSTLRIFDAAGVHAVNGSSTYDCVVTTPVGPRTSRAATLRLCVADVDDGSGRGRCDGGVTVDDLLLYVTNYYASGSILADVDNGSGTGTPDLAVTVDDLLYYLQQYEAGC